jgi:DNA-binding NarL/FixJ family response regulator
MFVARRNQENLLPNVANLQPDELGDAERSPDDSVTVLVVDDHDAFRRAMRDIVTATEGFTFVGEATSGEGALAVVSALAPKLMLVDKRMPGIGGVEAARLLAERHPGVVVVLVSVEEPDASDQRTCGAAAFVRKHQLCPGLLREVWLEHGC